MTAPSRQAGDAPTTCPSCRQLMSVHPMASQDGRPLALDICFACQGLWFDPRENLKLAPASVVEPPIMVALVCHHSMVCPAPGVPPVGAPRQYWASITRS